MMEEKNIQNEIVDAAATKAAEINNQAVETKTAELSEKLDEKASKEDVLKLGKSIDEVKEIATKNFNIGAPKRSGYEEFFKAAADGMVEVRKKGYGRVELDLKTFTAVDGADNYQIYREQNVDQIKYDPNHANRLRNYIPTGSASGGAVRFNQENSATDFSNAGPKAKGSAQTAVDIDLQPVTKTIQTLAAVHTIPQEWLDDTAMIESYLSSRLVGVLMDVEDDQILTGGSGSNDFDGINTDGTTYTQATFETLYGDLADSYAAADVNKLDALIATKAGMMNNNFRPSLLILNPLDVAALLLIKSSTREYVLQQTVTPDGSVQSFWNGLRVIEHPSQTSGTFTMIDPSAVQYWMNGGMTFSFGYNDDDFASNDLTARVLQRGAVTVYRPDGCANGTFTNAENALNSAS